jgi:hypothetical protein
MPSETRYANLGSLEELYRACVVEVDKLGTGFLIDRETALTCSHLFVASDKWNDPPESTILRWNGIQGTAKVTCIRTSNTRDRPDIAFLDDIHWENKDVVTPFAMLSNDWDFGDHYYVWGHPEGDFESDALTFTHDGAHAIHKLGPTYKKLYGHYYPAPGFSGSPILNRKSGVVCGLAAISLNKVAAEGVAAVPISYVFDYRPDLKDRLKKLHRTFTWWFDLTPSGRVWRPASKAFSGIIATIPQCYRNVGERHYQPREIEKHIEEFLASHAAGMFIVGDSGMGKTTLVARFAMKQETTQNLVALIESGRLSPELAALEYELASRLGRTDTSADVDEFWELLNKGAGWNEGVVILCIDAVNEYNQGGYDPRPVQLLDKLDRLIGKFQSSYSCIKMVITCRPETWRKAIETSPTRFRTNPDAYFRPGAEIAWMLPRFSEEEFKGAYEKYSTAGGFRSPFEKLSEVAKYHLRDPFLLTLAESAYRDQEVPSDLETGTLFETYLKELSGYEGVIKALVRAMFFGEGSPDAVKRTAIALEFLNSHNSVLYSQLDFENRLSAGSQLLERNVIRHWESRDESGGPVVQIRFTYDRFAEYLLSLRFLEMIEEKITSGMDLPTAAAALVLANLTPSQRMAVVYGALQRALAALSTKPNYSSILRVVAAIDARGQWLVISVLARAARNVENGIVLLTDLLKQLSVRERKGQKPFPVMDSVYRVLQDDEYRIWLAEQSPDLQTKHLDLLYKYFVDGFESSDATVSAAATQYLLFMWRSAQERRYRDALKITGLLVAQVRPLIRMFLSFQGRALFRSLTAEFVLIVPEASGDRFSKALELARDAIRRLKVGTSGRVAGVLVNSVLTNFLLRILRQLPNPVQLDSLDHYYANRHNLLPGAERILRLLGYQQNPSVCNAKEFRELTQSQNGILLQLLTFTLSTSYERAQSDGERSRILTVIEQCFFEEPRLPLAEYCSSLSIYHINVFGRHSTQDSMDLMGRMASDILSERKGRVQFFAKLHNFNIIGTYGRALHMHPATTSELGTNQWGMQFAFRALDQAVALQDSEYYLYICENLGLLGTLVEPRYLFDVFTRILQDVGALGLRPAGEALPFPRKTVFKARNQILQSLANIRVLYRQQVDKYLLEVLESPELYSEIANERTPDFRLSFFFSWSFEQLIFRCLVYDYDAIGVQILESFWKGMHCKSSARGTRALLSHLFQYVSELWK